jgi:hypothetical protein
MRHPSSFSRSPRAWTALLSAAAALLTTPARADDNKPCGNGYCDAWAGENAANCPADCKITPPAPALPPGAYPGMYPPGMYAPGLYAPGMYPPGIYPDDPRLARRWKSGDPPPPGFHVEQRPIQGLVIGGSITLGVAWVVGSAIGFSQAGNGGAYAVIPVVGPFVAAGVYQPPPCQSFLCFGPGFYKAFLITFGLIQSTGAVLLVSGLAAHHDTLVPGATIPRTGLTLMPVPIAGQNGNGLGLTGTF